MELSSHVEVGMDLEVIVHGCIVGMSAITQVEEEREDLTWVEGKVL